VQANKEPWLALCEQAAVEQDSKKLASLIAEINRLLKEKQDRLDQSRREHPSSNSN
jgi:hypothetical protein